MDEHEVARAFDVPPWLIGLCPRPRFARLRWALRRIWPLPGPLVVGDPHHNPKD